MILRINRCRSRGGYYLDKSRIKEIIEESWPVALRRASFDAFEGRYSEAEIGEKIDASQIKKEALQLILDTMEDTVSPSGGKKDISQSHPT